MSRINVVVRATGSEPPPVGAPIRVEIRDVLYEDAPATIAARADGEVTGPWPGEPDGLARVEVELESAPEAGIVFVHVDLDRDGRLSVGDFVTTQSYPVPAELPDEISVDVRRIGGSGAADATSAAASPTAAAEPTTEPVREPPLAFED